MNKFDGFFLSFGSFINMKILMCFVQSCSGKFKEIEGKWLGY